MSVDIGIYPVFFVETHALIGVGPVVELNVQFVSGGSKSKKMKLTVKGGAAVDPDSGKCVSVDQDI